MVNIKNVSPMKSALVVEGVVVKYGEVVDVPKDVADGLRKTVNFDKASVEDASKSKTSLPSSKSKSK